jgi:O-antigen/teichoic acid export membrane protein
MLVGGTVTIYAACGIPLTILLLGMQWIAPDTVFPILGAFWTIPVFLIAGSLVTALLGLLNTLQKHRTYVIGSVINAWLQPALAVLLAVVVAGTPESVMTGYALSSALILAGLLVVLRRQGLLGRSGDRDRPISLFRSMWVFAAPLMLVHLLYWTHTTANRYILDGTMGVTEVAVFVVAAAVARTPTQLAESMFGQVHQPALFRQIGMRPGAVADVGQAKQAMSGYIGAFLVIVCPVAFFTAVGAGMLMDLLAASAYRIGAIVVPWVAAAEFLRAASAVLSVAFEVERRPRPLILPMFAVAIVTLGLTYLLGRAVGALGAGIALAAGALVGYVWNQWQAVRLPCWSFPLRALATALAASVLIVGLAWLSSQLLAERGSLLQMVVYLAVFGLGYAVYAGPRIIV